MRLVLAFCATVLLAAASPAQPAAGDLIVTEARTPTRGRILVRGPGGETTLHAGFTGFFPNWVTMGEDNASLLVDYADGSRFSTGFLARVKPDGTLTVLAVTDSRLAFANGHEVDTDGTFLHAAQQGVLFRFDPAALTLRTLHRFAPILNDVALDRDTATVLALFFTPGPAPSPGGLFRWDPAGGGVTTLLFGGVISDPSAVVFDPATGDVLVSRFPAPGVVRWQARSGQVTTLVARAGMNALVTTPRGTFLAATETAVFEVDARGVTVRTVTFGSLVRITGVEEWGRRRLYVRGRGRPGQTVTVEIQTGRPADAGRSYYLALSLGTRPDALGPLAGGDYVRLAPDPLFFASALGWLGSLTKGFRGVLDSQARARATIHIPTSFPAGLRLPVHVGGLVVDPALPGGVATVLPSVTFLLE